MITLRTLSEIKTSALPASIKDHLTQLTACCDLADPPNDSIEDSLGGVFHILESALEASHIQCAEGRSMLEGPGTFDAVWEDDGWYTFLLCSSNAGGPTYLVPPGLVNGSMIQSKILTDALWN